MSENKEENKKVIVVGDDPVFRGGIVDDFIQHFSNTRSYADITPKKKSPPEMPVSLKERLMREYNLIKEKKSKLPRRERDAIVHYVERVNKNK